MSGTWQVRAEVWAMAAATLPLSTALAHVGVLCGVNPWVIALSSACVFSAALQLLVYQIAATSAPGPMLWITATLLPLRLLIYAIALGRHMSHWNVGRRLVALYFLTDISFSEFQRQLQQGTESALARYTKTSRALWLSWQGGTLVGLLCDRLAWPLPKEGLAVLVFACIALGQWGHDATTFRGWLCSAASRLFRPREVSGGQVGQATER